MNIIVFTSAGGTVIRPDTTWVRKLEDWYVPDFVRHVSLSHVLCARISRPGKCIAERFAERYYDAVGEGILFYPEDFLDGSEEGYARCCCLGHTSYICMPDKDKTLVSVHEREILRRALSEVSVYSMVRSGDILAVETGPRRHLCSRECGEYGMPGFKIIF